MKKMQLEGNRQGGIKAGKSRPIGHGSKEPRPNKSNNNKNLQKTKCGKGGRASEEAAKMLGTSRATIDRKVLPSNLCPNLGGIDTKSLLGENTGTKTGT